MEVEGRVKEINSPFMDLIMRAKSRLRGVERKVDCSISPTVSKVGLTLASMSDHRTWTYESRLAGASN